MPAPSRFPKGLSTENTGALRDFGLPNPAKWHVFFDDFDIYNASDWTITTTEAGSGSATEALADLDGGVLLITNDDADNDADFFQSNAEGFNFEVGKKLVFETRVRISDVTQTDFVAGLQVTDTTPLAVSNGVYFIKDDGDTNIDFYVTGTSTSTTEAAVSTFTDSSTWVKLGFYYDGKSTIEAYVDDVHVATTDTTNMPTTELAVSFGLQNGAAGAKALRIDYILAAKER